jgi:hypothetical protein
VNKQKQLTVFAGDGVKAAFRPVRFVNTPAAKGID